MQAHTDTGLRQRRPFAQSRPCHVGLHVYCKYKSCGVTSYNENADYPTPPPWSLSLI